MYVIVALLCSHFYITIIWYLNLSLEDIIHKTDSVWNQHTVCSLCNTSSHELVCVCVFVRCVRTSLLLSAQDEDQTQQVLITAVFLCELSWEAEISPHSPDFTMRLRDGCLLLGVLLLLTHTSHQQNTPKKKPNAKKGETGWLLLICVEFYLLCVSSKCWKSCRASLCNAYFL